MPPLTILWTRHTHDVEASTPKIVKDGTSDQRAFLPTLFRVMISIWVYLGDLWTPSGGWAEIQKPKLSAFICVICGSSVGGWVGVYFRNTGLHEERVRWTVPSGATHNTLSSRASDISC